MRDEQVVTGAGATGVVMQVLHAVTSPVTDGDDVADVRRVSDLRADGPAGARSRCRWTQHGHHDLDAHGRRRVPTRRSSCCAARTIRPGTVESADEVERFLRRVPSDTVVLLDEAYIEFVAPQHRIDVLALVRVSRMSWCVRTFSKAYGLAGLRIGYGFGAPELGPTAVDDAAAVRHRHHRVVAVAASYDADNQLRQRIRLITGERRHLRRRLRAMGVYSTDGHANFVYLPAAGRPWREVFDGTGLQVRHYTDGGVRITIGTRDSTRAVLAAVENAMV